MIQSKLPFVASVALLCVFVTDKILPSSTITIQLNKRFFSITTGLIVAYTLAKSIE
jgi:hypothetical protein